MNQDQPLRGLQGQRLMCSAAVSEDRDCDLVFVNRGVKDRIFQARGWKEAPALSSHTADVPCSMLSHTWLAAKTVVECSPQVSTTPIIINMTSEDKSPGNTSVRMLIL